MDKKDPGPTVTERPNATANATVEQIRDATAPREAAPLVPRQPQPGHLAARELIVKDALQGLLPSTIGEAIQVSNLLAKSKAVPKYLYDKPETVFTIIMAGLEIGLTPIRAIQNLQNIHGNLGMKADLQLAMVRKSGLLEFFDEGYEEHQVTDIDLAERTQDGKKILQLVKILKSGNPYGWCTMKRRGDATVITKVFSYADAERAFTWEKDEDNPNARSEKKKLSEKFNFQAWPMDMYPKRARVRVVQVAFPDVTAGIPAVEHLQDKAVVEGEVITTDDEAPDADVLMREIIDGDEDLGKRIVAGFDQLKMAGAKKLTHLVRFRGKPNDLFKFLQDEYALRKTAQTKARPNVLGTDDPKGRAASVASDTKQTPQPQTPKPWQVENDSPRASWIEHNEKRTILQPSEKVDLDDEPDALGRGVIITRRLGEQVGKPAVAEAKAEPDSQVVEGEPVPETPQPATNRLKNLADKMKDVSF